MPKISYLIFVSFVDFHVANTFRIHMKKDEMQVNTE